MELHAWCIMTSHVHLIFRSINNQNPELLLAPDRSGSRDLQAEILQKQFKKILGTRAWKCELAKQSRKEFLLDYFKREAEKSSNTTNFKFWRHDNKPIELWSNKVIQQKIDYIHNNPVEEGIVFRAEDYKYSSATDYAGQKGLLNNICVFEYFEL